MAEDSYQIAGSVAALYEEQKVPAMYAPLAEIMNSQWIVLFMIPTTPLRRKLHGTLSVQQLQKKAKQLSGKLPMKFSKRFLNIELAITSFFCSTRIYMLQTSANG
ncbi:MAG: hypothetical protein ISR45_06525 [Rhodospirillales bacterium]|nr:hypothetical protein [Rhodospirillales bacterium]